MFNILPRLEDMPLTILYLLFLIAVGLLIEGFARATGRWK